jgi:flagellar hook-associated protein 1 FlgK
MSFFGLNLIGSALDAFGQAANTTSDNIANVNTPGASRQIVNLGEAPPIVGSTGYATWYGPGTKGDGVLVQSIARVHQDSYDGLFRGASAAQNFYQTQSQQLQAVQAAFGEPSNGINTAFANLQTAFSQLSANPTGTSERTGVIAAAQAFVTQLNSVGSSIQNAKATAIAQATTVVAQANDLIDKIAALNGQIRASKAVGDNPNTDMDQRDADIDQLSQLLSTQTSVQANGSTLVTVGGRALVNDTQAYHLAAPVVGTDASGNPALVIGFVNDPNPSNPAPVQVGSGQLGGYLDLYNNKLTVYGRQLDNFANATATEINAVTSAGYDQNGNQGLALLQPVVAAQTITATNIKVGITDPAQVPAALASTAAGNLTAGVNAANNVVDTASAVAGNATLFHPGVAGGATGTLNVTVDGVTTAYAYDFTATGKEAPIDGFITNFNAAQLGVKASFDDVSQKLVFTRDPNNVSLAHRAAVAAAGAAVSASFSIADTNPLAGGSQGTPTTSLLEILGAGAINGVTQDSTNAFGPSDNNGANAVLTVFTKNAGVPGLQTTSPTAIGAPGSVTVAPPAGNLQAFAQLDVGALLTIDAGTANQENVVVTAVNRTTGAITFSATKTHAANFSITTGQAQTLGAYYGGLVGRVGLDTKTASTGESAQSTLASNIDKVRQGIDGINLDEETQNLVKYQNSYQAAAKTLNVLDQLLQTALGLIPGG